MISCHSFKWEINCILGNNGNTCVTGLTKSRDFISVQVQSHFADNVLPGLKFLGEQKLES